MANYVDKIMSNHVFNSESSEDLSHLYSDKEYEDFNMQKQKKRKAKKQKGGASKKR